jgi:hypothetical protein
MIEDSQASIENGGSVAPNEDDIDPDEELDESMDDEIAETDKSNDKLAETEVMQAAMKHDLDLTPQLRALLKSQIQIAPPSLTRRNPRRLQPVIAELNIWHRPMPQVRVKNMKQQHYAYLLARTLPPLPENEWTRLRDLASGRIPIEAPISRRSLQDSTRKNSDSALEVVVRYGKVPKNVFENRKVHALTPRFMRRLYGLVFSQCPLMEFDATKDTWTITWGGRALQGGSSGRMKSASVAPSAGKTQEAVLDHVTGTQARPKLTTANG